MAIHAHPDDESSKGAGTVAHYAAQGVRCILVTVTGGEAGDILNPAMDRPEVIERLAEIRSEELHRAAAILGYSEVIELGYRDSGMPDTEANGHSDALVNIDHDEVLGKVVALVRSFKPEIVLGYDDHERYPHPDHLAVHRLGLELFDAAADGSRFPAAGDRWEIARLLAPVFTVRRLMALHRACVERNIESPFERWLEGLDETGDDAKKLIAVDVADMIEVGRAALRAHETQVDPDGFWFTIPADVVAEVYPFEDFEVLRTRVELPRDTSDLFGGL